MKCIGDKCPKHFSSHFYHFCYIADRCILEGEECIGQYKVKDLENQISEINKTLEYVRNNQ